MIKINRETLLRRKNNPDMDYGTVYMDSRIIEGKGVGDIKVL